MSERRDLASPQPTKKDHYPGNTLFLLLDAKGLSLQMKYTITMPLGDTLLPIGWTMSLAHPFPKDMGAVYRRRRDVLNVIMVFSVYYKTELLNL